MVQQSELLRRLRGLPSEKRAEFLKGLQNVSPSNRTSPLSFRQEQIWVLNKISTGVEGYRLAFRFRLDGPLDLAAFQRALDDVFARHTVLRSVFPPEDPEGKQVVLGSRSVPLQFEDAESYHNDFQSLESEVLWEELPRGFDLEAGPMVRLRLLRLNPTEHHLLWISHHLVFDHRSAKLIAEDLASSYAAWTESRPPELPPAASFGEYAVWQREWVSGDEGAEARAWWRATLSGWEATEIVADHPREPLVDLSAGTVEQEIDTGSLTSARTLAGRLGVSLEDVLLGTYFALVQRHTAQDDLVIGVPVQVYGPMDPQRLVGDCGNLLPVRVDLSGNPTFADTVRRVREERVAAERYAALPFKVMVEDARVDRDPTRLPLVQLGFDARPETSRIARSSGLDIEVETLDSWTTAFEMLLEIEIGETSYIQLRYATALYEETTALRIVDRYVRLLRRGCVDPDNICKDLPMASEEERQSILEEWNQPETSRPAELLHSVFEAQVRLEPDAVAIASTHGETTYRQLDEGANRLAYLLRDMGIGPEQVVPIVLQRSSRVVETILAILKAGAGYVPIDPSQPAERIAKILCDCAPTVIVAERATSSLLPEGQWTVVDLDLVSHQLLEAPSTPPQVDVQPQGLAYVMYTSGSSGVPKGVMIEHRNATNFIRTVQETFALGPEDRFVQFASPSFDVSVFEIFGSLLTGARLYVMDEQQRGSIDEIDRILVEENISIIDLPPTIMGLLSPQRYEKLRVVFVGGEAFSGELTTRWAAGGRQFYNGYGPTETTVTVIAKRCEGVWRSSPPIGRAMGNHQAYGIGTNLEVVPVGAPGELAIAGAGLGRGYMGRPDLTADRFRPDPYGSPGSRLYLTGDITSWLPSGELLYLGRADRQVKVRGVRIELGEVEAALLALPEVEHAVADVTRDLDHETVLVAYLVPAADGVMHLDVVRAAVSDRLPPAMVPNFLVPLDAVPLTTSGKVDRNALPAVEFTQPVHELEADVEERTDTERRVAEEVFAPLLGSDRGGNHDNFFALGGTSLQAIRIVPLVKGIFGIEMPVAEFFQNPTIAGTAHTVDSLLGSEKRSRRDLLEALDLVEGRSDEEVAEMLRSRSRDQTGNQSHAETREHEEKESKDV